MKFKDVHGRNEAIKFRERGLVVAKLLNPTYPIVAEGRVIIRNENDSWDYKENAELARLVIDYYLPVVIVGVKEYVILGKHKERQKVDGNAIVVEEKDAVIIWPENGDDIWYKPAGTTNIYAY